ncbi:TPA: ABC transporter substrate-binding protein [Vibrio campbellii]|nr:ABC transporter substrate-binding protein [Vibrio campbellii]
MQAQQLLIAVSLLAPVVCADTFYADIRHRPPEMVLSSNQESSGPLKDILEKAVTMTGHTIKWRTAPFTRSLHALKQGYIDIVPRVIRTSEREAFVLYLGPIGCQKKDILFLVHKGNEELIRDYADLHKVKVGVKRGTAYYSVFDTDTNIQKVELKDDANMARMFILKRFDVMAVLDRNSIEMALGSNEFTDYSYAEYKHQQTIGIYYGMSHKSSLAFRYKELNQALLTLSESGAVAEIYASYGIEPPLGGACSN